MAGHNIPLGSFLIDGIFSGWIPQSNEALRRAWRSVSLILVSQKRPAFHRHAQRTAFRRRDARQQSRSFDRWNQSLRRSANSNRLLLRLSAIISQYFTRAAFCLFCSPHGNDEMI